MANVCFHSQEFRVGPCPDCERLVADARFNRQVALLEDGWMDPKESTALRARVAALEGIGEVRLEGYFDRRHRTVMFPYEPVRGKSVYLRYAVSMLPEDIREARAAVGRTVEGWLNHGAVRATVEEMSEADALLRHAAGKESTTTLRVPDGTATPPVGITFAAPTDTGSFKDISGTTRHVTGGVLSPDPAAGKEGE